MNEEDALTTLLTPIVDDVFLSRLTTGLLSSPIIIIPHYHYSYLEEALKIIVDKAQSGDNGIQLTMDNIREVSESSGVLDFTTKRQKYSDRFSNVISNIVNGLDENEHIIKGTAKPQVIVYNGTLSCIFEDKDTVSTLVSFVTLYEQGRLPSLSTIILMDDISLSDIAASLFPYTMVINVPLPSDDTIAKLLERLPLSKTVKEKEDGDKSDFLSSMVRIFQGLHQQQILSILRSILVRTGGFLSEPAKVMAEREKKNMLRKSNLVNLVESNVSLDDVGGLEVLKNDIRLKARIFKHLDLATSPGINLQLPKGIMILGMPGCGKSMIAKAIANEFDMPLLRLDISSMMGKYVGESEANLRKALDIAEAAHPCVLWIDEVEKAFAGSGSSDGDSVLLRLMGYFLTWMQEKQQPVYVVATANDAMRSEFMRKGRFDEVYFVDFPNEQETEEILKKKIHRYNNPNSRFDFHKIGRNQISTIATSMQLGEIGSFAGSEIEAVVTEVIENAFNKLIDYSIGLKITIELEDFNVVIREMRHSIMASQKGVGGKKTNIERIREIKDSYSLKSATKKNVEEAAS